MRQASPIRRTARCVAIATALAVLGVFAYSFWQPVELKKSGRAGEQFRYLLIENGGIQIETYVVPGDDLIELAPWYEQLNTDAEEYWSRPFHLVDFELNMSPRIYSQGWVIRMPAWPMVLAASTVGGWFWRKEILIGRRRREGLCLACGYDRSSLAADAVCPECGTVSAPPPSPP
jgi:hypothetical protein